MTITGLESVLDSRDLQEELDALREEEELDEDDRERMRELEVMEQDIADWEYGATLIRESYFKEYAMELADEIGALPKEYSWPTSCIDWNQAARELQMDYTAYELGGVTYYARA